MLVLQPSIQKEHDPRKAARDLLGSVLNGSVGKNRSKGKQSPGDPSHETKPFQKGELTGEYDYDISTYSTQSMSASSLSSRPAASRIRFSTVEVREHPVTLGDNPAVTEGLPLTLEWEASNSQSFSIDQYEESLARSHERFEGPPKIPMEVRQRLLLQQGYSPDYLAMVEDEVRAIQLSRFDNCPPFFWEDSDLPERTIPITRDLVRSLNLDAMDEYRLMANSSRRSNRRGQTTAPIPADNAPKEATRKLRWQSLFTNRKGSS